jgi:hypothetical protein
LARDTEMAYKQAALQRIDFADAKYRVLEAEV